MVSFKGTPGFIPTFPSEHQQVTLPSSGGCENKKKHTARESTLLRSGHLCWCQPEAMWLQSPGGRRFSRTHGKLLARRHLSKHDLSRGHQDVLPHQQRHRFARPRSHGLPRDEPAYQPISSLHSSGATDGSFTSQAVGNLWFSKIPR